MRKNQFLTLFFILLTSVAAAYAGTLSCSITTAAACTGGTNVILLRMSGSTNAHAELPSQATAGYSNNVICCSGVTGITTSCSGTFATILKLNTVTNSHVQQNTVGTYANSACLAIPSGSVTIGYNSNCTGFDTTLASISAVDNAHIGNTTTYATSKICGTAGTVTANSITFAILSSTSTAFSGSSSFGTLSTAQTRYASSTASGDTIENVAHVLAVNTNASSGYIVTAQGATLASGANTITALASNTAPSINTSQFGIRLVATGGSGTVTAPYAASGFAYTATATTTAQVASATTGDSATTTYAVRYMANIIGTTSAGNYTTNIVYVATANF